MYHEEHVLNIFLRGSFSVYNEIVNALSFRNISAVPFTRTRKETCKKLSPFYLKLRSTSVFCIFDNIWITHCILKRQIRECFQTNFISSKCVMKVPLDPVTIHMNWVHNLISCVLRIYSNIILSSKHWALNWFNPSRFFEYNFISISHLPMLSTCSAHLILQHFIALIIFGEKNKTWRSSSSNFVCLSLRFGCCPQRLVLNHHCECFFCYYNINISNSSFNSWRQLLGCADYLPSQYSCDIFYCQ